MKNKKKLVMYLFVMVIVILFIVSFCLNNLNFISLDKNSLRYEIRNFLVKDYDESIYNISCDYLNSQNKTIAQNYFINENNVLYWYQPFNIDNKKGNACYILNSTKDYRFSYIIDNKIFVSINNEVVYLTDSYNLINMKKKYDGYEKDSNFLRASFYQTIINDNENVSKISRTYSNFDWEAFDSPIVENLIETFFIDVFTIENGSLYKLSYSLKRDESLDIYYELIDKSLYNIDVISNNEEVIDIFYATSEELEKINDIKVPTIIKTNKAFYIYGFENKSCFKYEKKGCKLNYYKSSIINKYYSDILYVNNQVIIDKNLNSYPLLDEFIYID